MRKWTPHEEETLARYYDDKPSDWNGWEEVLPGRGYDARRVHARILGLSRRRGPEQKVTDEQIIAAIDEFWVENGYAPCFRDVMSAVGFKSPSTIKYRIERLAKEGRLEHEKKVPRSMRVIG